MMCAQIAMDLFVVSAVLNRRAVTHWGASRRDLGTGAFASGQQGLEVIAMSRICQASAGDSPQAAVGLAHRMPFRGQAACFGRSARTGT